MAPTESFPLQEREGPNYVSPPSLPWQGKAGNRRRDCQTDSIQKLVTSYISLGTLLAAQLKKITRIQASVLISIGQVADTKKKKKKNNNKLLCL